MSGYGFLPRRMRLSMAAYYLSVSETTFLTRVRAGIYPQGRREGGMTFWLVDELDEHVEVQFDRQTSKKSTNEDPFLSRFGSGS